MADQEKIELRIAPDGTVSAETRGVVGPKCLNLIEVLEDLLDATTTHSEYTHDYYSTPIQETNPDVLRQQ